MNERISQLAEQILPHDKEFFKGNRADFGFLFESNELEAFVALIIKDVVNLLPDNCQAANGCHVSRVIEEHFGIK